MPKVRDLINFERIRDVIDIDTIDDAKEMVERYIISPDIEDHLVHVFGDLNKSTHKAVQIIGNYGSGKSHLLAFLISLLTQKELRHHIYNERVRQYAEQLERDFAVVHWELQPNDVTLSDYFYDNIETQLSEKYGIEVNLQTTGAVDHKKNILKVVEAVKKDNPTRGFIVVIDEVSDFLKTKTKENINRDMQFLRVLGQSAQAFDFSFFGAMQEQVFSNPKYVDEAESFGRVSERFNVITIKRENIKRVISRRVLNKNPEQRQELEALFNQYVKYFPNLRSNIDEYIDLFPLHPYVIQIFSELPYFEKRGIIQFTIQEVEKILDKEFPYLITYNKIYDEIESKHNVKHIETVAPVMEAVQTLESKIDLLEDRHQETARNIVKALAVLKLYGKTINNGATVEELANTLLQLPGNKMMEATDEITLVLNNLRKVTDGQFINVNSDGYYYLDLKLQVDYDQVIARRTENLPSNALDDEILSILKNQLMLREEISPYAFTDTCRWESRRSFRNGVLIYETGKGEKVELNEDYQIVILSPFCSNNRYRPTVNTIVISVSLNSETVEDLKRLAAAKALINDDYSRSIMEKKYTALRKTLVSKLVKEYLENGKVDNGISTKTVKSLIAREFTNFDELLSEIKPSLLEEYFADKYPKHPKFHQNISRDSIKADFNSAVKEIIDKTGSQKYFSSSKSILNALNLIDDKGNFATNKSEVAQKILEAAKAAQGKNVDVEEIIKEYQKIPYGYHPLMTQFLLVILTYNGEIALKASGGKVITSSEVEDTFKSGMDVFENIKYLVIESDLNPQPIINLFSALDLTEVSSKLRVTSKRGEAVQHFRTRYLEIKEKIQEVNSKLERLSLTYQGKLDIDGLKSKNEQLNNIPLGDFDQVKTPNDFKKVIYDQEVIDSIQSAYNLLKALDTFYTMFFEKIASEVDYAIEAKKVILAYPSLFEQQDIIPLIEDSFAVLADSDRLIKLDELNPLLGKLQQVKKKYQTAFYQAHESCVGSKVNWNRLEEITDSLTYKKLSVLKGVSLIASHGFVSLESEIAALKQSKCLDFKIELLDDKPTCRNCGFPAGYTGHNINNRIDSLVDEIEKVFDEWENSILTELNAYRDNLQYLNPQEKSLVEKIIQQGRLPNSVSDELVVALNNLFRELDIICVNPNHFVDSLFSDGQVIDYYTFERRLAKIKQDLVAGKDLSKVRIKLTEKGD